MLKFFKTLNVATEAVDLDTLIQIGRYTDRQITRLVDIQIGRYTDRQITRLVDIQIGR